MAGHLVLVHEGPKPFKCNKCNSTFKSIQGLTGHIASVHEEKKQFKCEICNSSFAQTYQLKGHKTLVHEGPKPKDYSKDPHKAEYIGPVFTELAAGR